MCDEYSGDLEITHESTRAFGIFYVLLFTSIFTAAVGNFLDVFYSPYESEEEKKKTSVLTSPSEKMNDSRLHRFSAPSTNTHTKDRLILEILLRVSKDATLSETIEKVSFSFITTCFNKISILHRL